MIVHGRQQIYDLTYGKAVIGAMSIGRYDLSLSHYSAQATAALKAQFPTQWPTIRDYGFAHPEYIVGINLAAPQDPDIMYSLIPELGKHRWLSNADASQRDYIIMAFDYNTLQDTMYCKYMFLDNNPTISSRKGALFGAFKRPPDSNIAIHTHWWRTGFNTDTYATLSPDAQDSPIGTVLESYCSATRREIKSAGVTMGISTTVFTSSVDYTELPIFCNYDMNAVDSYFYGRFGILEIGGVHKQAIIPVKYNGVNTLINLATGFVGTPNNPSRFSISETPAS